MAQNRTVPVQAAGRSPAKQGQLISRTWMTRLTIGAVAALLLAATSAALLQSRNRSSSGTHALTLPTKDSMQPSRASTATYRKRMRTSADELGTSMDALEASLADATDAGRAKSKKALADLRQRMTSLQDVMAQYMPDLGDLTDTDRLKEAAGHGYTRLESAAQDMRESLAGLADYVTDTANSSFVGASQAVHKAYDEALESSNSFTDLLAKAKDAGTAKVKEGAEISREALTAAYDQATNRFDMLSQALSEQAASSSYAAKEGATHAAHQVADAASQTKDAVVDKTKEGARRTGEAASNVAGAASDAAGTVVNKTKEGASAATSSAARLAAAARDKAYRAYSAAYEELHDAWSQHGVLHEAASDVGDTASSAADYAHQAFDKASARLKDVAERARAHLAPQAEHEAEYDEATQRLHDQLDATKEALMRVMGTNEPTLTEKAKQQLQSSFDSMMEATARVKDGTMKQRMRDELAAAYDDVMQTLLVHPPPSRLERLKANLRHML